MELADVPRLKDKIELINSFQKGNYSNRLQVLGREFDKNISKEIYKGFTVALTQCPENLRLFFENFDLSHKTFWRIVFAMRHTKSIHFSYCAITDIKHISDQFHIDLCGITNFSIFLSDITSADNDLLQTNGAQRILFTLAILKKMGSKDKIPIKIDFSHSNIEDKQLENYIKPKSFGNVLEIINLPNNKWL